MKDHRHFFKEILLIELDDLMEDVRQLILVYADKLRKEEITHFVEMANMAFFQEEISGLSGYIEDVKHFNVEEPADINEMAVTLKAMLFNRVKQHDLPRALISLVERRIDKVHCYVRQEDNLPVAT